MARKEKRQTNNQVVIDTDLYEIVKALQAGDAEAAWKFTEHSKIRAIVGGRLRQYRNMYYWLPIEDLEDIDCGLRPKLIEIAAQIKLSEMPNDGRLISYFSLRIKGEADFLLKKISGMRQAVDEDTGASFLRCVNHDLANFTDVFEDSSDVDNDVIEQIENDERKNIFGKILNDIPRSSNDLIWLKAYQLRIGGANWGDVARGVGFKPSEYIFLRNNTLRYLSRLKDKMNKMGIRTRQCICGVYCDDNEVALSVVDSTDRTKNVIWSRPYDTYQDLEKIETKVIELFRQYEVNYVVLNEELYESRAAVIMTALFFKKEAFINLIDIRPFIVMLDDMPTFIAGVSTTRGHKIAHLLALIKKACLDIEFDFARN